VSVGGKVSLNLIGLYLTEFCDNLIKLDCQCKFVEGVDPVAKQLVVIVHPKLENIENSHVISDRFKI